MTLASATIQYLHARNTSFIYQTASAGVPPLVGCPLTPSGTAGLFNANCSGFQSNNAPDWTMNFALQHTIEFGDYGVVLSADTQYKSARYIAFQFLPQQRAPSVWRTNAQIKFRPDDEKWSVSGYVQNIENNRTSVFIAAAPITNLLVAGTTLPTTYGIRASLNF
jgi:iron complex outermembrane recepter protein